LQHCASTFYATAFPIVVIVRKAKLVAAEAMAVVVVIVAVVSEWKASWFASRG
jgi:hypothetical protein